MGVCLAGPLSASSCGLPSALLCRVCGWTVSKGSEGCPGKLVGYKGVHVSSEPPTVVLPFLCYVFFFLSKFCCYFFCHKFTVLLFVSPRYYFQANSFSTVFSFVWQCSLDKVRRSVIAYLLFCQTKVLILSSFDVLFCQSPVRVYPWGREIAPASLRLRRAPPRPVPFPHTGPCHRNVRTVLRIGLEPSASSRQADACPTNAPRS